MADTKLADYKTELLELVAQVRSAGVSENTAGRMADLLERIVNTFDGFSSNEQLKALRDLTTRTAFLYGMYANTKTNPPVDGTNRLYFTAEPGVYTNFPDADGKPLTVTRPCMIFRNSVHNVWSLSPFHGLYEFSQSRAFGETIGWIGGSVCELAFRTTASFNYSDFPLKDAIVAQLEANSLVAAKAGAGAVWPKQPHGTPNFQVQAEQIAPCGKYVIWLSTNDCTNKVPLEEFKQGMNKTIATLRNKTPDCKVMLINPLRCRLNGKLTKGEKGYAEGDPGNDPYSTDAFALHLYADAVKEIANNWNIPVLDLFRNSFLDIFGSHMMDGTHPLPSGYALLADQILNFIVKGNQSSYVGDKAAAEDLNKEVEARANGDKAAADNLNKEAEARAKSDSDLKKLTTRSAYLVQGFAHPTTDAPNDETNRIFFVYEKGVYTHFLDNNGRPLNVTRPCMIMRNMAWGNYWTLSPYHGLYEFSQSQSFGKKIGWIGGSVTELAFRDAAGYGYKEFPLKDALIAQLECNPIVAAKAGAGAVWPPQPNGVPNFQIQAQQIEACDKYVIWVSTNDCSNKVPLDEFREGLNNTIVTLRKRFPNCKIMLMNALRCRYNGSLPKGANGYAEGDRGNDPYSDDPNAMHRYAEITLEVANNWEFPVLDLYHGAFLDIFNSNFMRDGTHPLPVGYAQITDQIVHFIVSGGYSKSSYPMEKKIQAIEASIGGIDTKLTKILEA